LSQVIVYVSIEKEVYLHFVKSAVFTSTYTY